MTTESICTKLNPFFNNLSFVDVVPAHRAVGEYILLRDTRKFNADVDFLDKEICKIFSHEVKEMITTDHLFRCIWRAVYLAIRRSMKWEDAAKKYGIDINDILFCWDPLDAKTRRKVRAAARSTQILSFLTSKQLNDLVESLVPYCRTVAYKKLRFIEDNDHAYKNDDLVSELLIQALKVIRRYEHFSTDGKTHNIAKIQNYARSAISNYAKNMINKHTNVARARVENITNPCGHCASCKSGKIHKCENVIQDFRQTTLRLDIPMTDDNSTLYDLLGSYDNTVEERNTLDNYIKPDLSPKMQTFVDIVVSGKSTPEFDYWLSENYCTSVDELFHSQRKLAKHAMRFLHLRENIVRQKLAVRCVSHSSKSSTKCVSCRLVSWCTQNSPIRITSRSCAEYTPIYSKNNNL